RRVAARPTQKNGGGGRLKPPGKPGRFHPPRSPNFSKTCVRSSSSLSGVEPPQEKSENSGARSLVLPVSRGVRRCQTTEPATCRSVNCAAFSAIFAGSPSCGRVEG